MPTLQTQIPDFEIQHTGEISKACIANQLHSFRAALHYIHNLPYGRNASRTDFAALFKEQRGTCSTKHAFLKQLALENDQHGLHLFVGLYKMNGGNTKPVAQRLKDNGLDHIPEAHCYLKFNGRVYDVTMPGSAQLDFEKDLLEELEILPEQVGDFKVAHHKNYVAQWLKANPHISYSFDQLWQIREDCIRDLSNHQ